MSEEQRRTKDAAKDSSKKKSAQGRSTGKGTRKKSAAGKHGTGTARNRKRRRRKRRSSMVGYIIFAAAVIMFIISAVSLVRIGLEYKKGTDTYDEIAREVISEERPEDTAAKEPVPKETGEGSVWLPYVDFDSLKLISQDAEGWIYFPDMGINYPIVYGKDNVYYLTHMIDGTANNAGTLFTDMRNTKGFADTNTIIYGHNMKNGSMFGLLKKYGEEAYYREHPLFYLYTEAGVWEYDIFSVRVVDETSDSYTMTFASESDYLAYLDQAFRKSMYDTGVTVNAQDQIVTLSTCTSKETDRLIIQAVKGEKIR